MGLIFTLPFIGLVLGWFFVGVFLTAPMSRELLGTSGTYAMSLIAGSLVRGLSTAAAAGADERVPPRTSLGLVTYCCRLPREQLRASQTDTDLFAPARFLEHCRGLGAGGMITANAGQIEGILNQYLVVRMPHLGNRLDYPGNRYRPPVATQPHTECICHRFVDTVAQPVAQK